MILEKIEELIQHLNISYNKFEDSINASRGSISGAIKKKRNIGSNVIEKILHKYPISAEWLTRGVGEIELSTVKQLQEPSLNYGVSNDDALIKKLVSFFNFETKAQLIDFIERVNEKQEIANSEIMNMRLERLEDLIAKNILDMDKMQELIDKKLL